MGNKEIPKDIFDLCHVSKVAAHFKKKNKIQKKNKIVVNLLKYPNKESEKILKNKAAETYLEPC